MASVKYAITPAKQLIQHEELAEIVTSPTAFFGLAPPGNSSPAASPAQHNTMPLRLSGLATLNSAPAVEEASPIISQAHNILFSSQSTSPPPLVEYTSDSDEELMPRELSTSADSSDVKATAPLLSLVDYSSDEDDDEQCPPTVPGKIICVAKIASHQISLADDSGRHDDTDAPHHILRSEGEQPASAPQTSWWHPSSWCTQRSLTTVAMVAAPLLAAGAIALLRRRR
jgi:hypothetical protein